MAIVFFKSGRWSGINVAVEGILRREFPEQRLVVIDLYAELRRRPLLLLRLILIGLVRLRPPLQLGRGEFGFWQYSAAGQSAVRDLALTLAKRALGDERPLFTFQTTTRFCADGMGVPHFAFVDTAESLKPLGPSGERTRVERAVLSLESRLFGGSARTFTHFDRLTRGIVRDYHVDAERVITVYGGMSAPLMRGPISRDESAQVILFVAVEWRRKGGDVLVEAFRRVRATFPRAELRIVGVEPRIDVDGCVILGRQTRDGVARELERATVFCLPSRRDYFPNVIREAMHYGVPVVTTNTSGIPDMMRDGETCLIIDPEDVDALVEALTRLLSDQELRETMGAAAMELARTRFTWEAVGETMAREIRPLVA